MPADGAVRYRQFRRSVLEAAKASGRLEGAQSVKRRQRAARNGLALAPHLVKVSDTSSVA
jgi:hypothetical protein